MSKVCFFQTSELSKATTFVKRCLWAYFHQAGGLQNKQNLALSSFSSFRAFKSLHLCQNRSFSIFSPSWLLTKWAKFAFFEFFNLQNFQESPLLSKDVFEYFHQAGGLQNEQVRLFRVFQASDFRAFKSLHFCQKMSLSIFSPSGRLTKWAKFSFSSSSIDCDNLI